MKRRGRESSAASAARFLATYRGPQRSSVAAAMPPAAVLPSLPRYVLNIAELTLVELRICVDERLARFERDGVEPPHATKIARKMLEEHNIRAVRA